MVASLLALLLALSVLATPTIAARQPVCSFALGFAALHDALPREIGECVDNERPDPSGDSVQRTTSGLLVWRKLDNWTAFTDGASSWVNGPFGIQQRPNDRRFAWESNPEGFPITPPVAPGERCHTAGLSLAVVDSDAGAGNIVATFRFHNELDVACSFFGYVGAQLLDGDRQPLPTQVIRGGGPLVREGAPTVVNVQAGASADFRVHWTQIEVGNETNCPVAHYLSVIPPDEFAPVILPITIRACGAGRLDVGPMTAT